jgi:hypothetical protein
MIDTIRIGIPLRERLNDHEVSKVLNDLSKKLRYGKNILNLGRFQIIFPKKPESGMVYAQCSLPNFAKGSNVEPLTLSETIATAQAFVEAVSRELGLGYVPGLDEVKVTRADIVFDWIVQSPEAYQAVLRDYIIERANHGLQFNKSATNRGSTVKAGSKAQHVSVYNKEAQSEYRNNGEMSQQHVRDKARGRLRIEVQVSGRQWKKYVIGTPSLGAVFAYLHQNGRRVLAGVWERATQGWETSCFEADLTRLISKHGLKKGRQTAGTLAMIRRIGVPAFRQICKPSPASFYRFRCALREAGVSLTQPSGLERLSIPWFDPESWRAKRAWSFYHLASIVSEAGSDEFEVDEDGNVWDFSIQNVVTMAAWDEAA